MFLQRKGAEDIAMEREEKIGGCYRVEVSGWDLGEHFFVEKTMLNWQENGSKKVWLRAPLGEGTLVFVRLAGESANGRGVPMTYLVEKIEKDVTDKGHEVELERLHPRFTENRRKETSEEEEAAKPQ